MAKNVNNASTLGKENGFKTSAQNVLDKHSINLFNCSSFDPDSNTSSYI